MSLANPYYVGLQNVGSYQVSGTPYASGNIALSTSPTEITFPEVTQRIVIGKNAGDNVRVGFSANGVNGTNYYLISGSATEAEFKVKASSVFLRANTSTSNVSVFAELTNIDVNLLAGSGPSGSNWSGSVGVG